MEFDGVMDSSELMHDLQDLGVDVAAFIDYAHFEFRDKDELTVAEFLEMVIQFRGSKAATVKDVVDMRKFVSMELRKFVYDINAYCHAANRQASMAIASPR